MALAGRDNIKWEDPSCLARPDDYIVVNGRRYVRPYFFEFIAHVKRRWDGLKIAELFAKEFRQRPYEYYVEAINAGRITFDGQRVLPDHAVRESHTMSHFVHRHEPPVQATPVQVLLVTPDVITVCKPASMPVHPCGQYRKNTVLGILAAEHDFSQLFPIHRLDRLVSGLLILARSSISANRFRQQGAWFAPHGKGLRRGVRVLHATWHVRVSRADRMASEGPCCLPPHWSRRKRRGLDPLVNRRSTTGPLLVTGAPMLNHPDDTG